MVTATLTALAPTAVDTPTATPEPTETPEPTATPDAEATEAAFVDAVQLAVQATLDALGATEPADPAATETAIAVLIDDAVQATLTAQLPKVAPTATEPLAETPEITGTTEITLTPPVRETVAISHTGAPEGAPLVITPPEPTDSAPGEEPGTPSDEKEETDTPATPTVEVSTDPAAQPPTAITPLFASAAVFLNGGRVNGVAIAPAGMQLAAATDGGLWIGTVEGGGGEGGTLYSTEQPLSTVSWAPDALTVATGAGASAGASGVVTTWNSVDGTALTTVDTIAAGVTAVGWSPAGTRLAAGALDEMIYLWEVDGLRSSQWGSNGAPVLDIAWSPDGTRLAAAADDAGIHLWDAGSGEETMAITDGEVPITSVAWSPDGTQLVTGGNRTVTVWNAANGAPLLTLDDLAGTVVDVAWSPESNQIAAALVAEETEVALPIYVWDVVSGRPLYALLTEQAAITALAWSVENNQLVAGTADGFLVRWDME